MGSHIDVADVVTLWSPPVEWAGETAFVIGGGPSLTPDDVNRLEGRKVIAVNAAYRLAPWAQYLFFSDHHWFLPREKAVAGFAGTVVTTSRRSVEALSKIKLVARSKGRFPERGTPELRAGKSSGGMGVSLAYALGASRIVMLGFDMRTVDGKSHWHEEYFHRPADSFEPYYRDIFIPAFNGWNEDAKANGVTILNATPGSAIKEFPFVSLDEVL